MFAKTIIDSDAFLDMPQSTQNLYFHLGMRADDDGFINNPKKIQRMANCSDDDAKLLCAKNFVIPFESGVVVIKHWLIHNLIRGDRYKETVYKEELAMLDVKPNKAYTCKLGIPNGNQMEPQVRLGKASLGEVSIGKHTHTEAPDVSVGVLESIKHPSNLPKLIYDKWQAIPGVTKDCDYMYWIQREWREIARAIEGFHSDIVLNSLDNYKKERDNPNTWMTAKVSSRQFFTGGLFETCRGATDVKKQVPRCKACTCQLLPDGVPNAGTCQNDECDMYHRRQE
jgi:hypothetical protein